MIWLPDRPCLFPGCTAKAERITTPEGSSGPRLYCARHQREMAKVKA